MAFIGLAFIVLAGCVSFVGSIMMLFAAFRASVLWGLLVMFVPFGAFVFIFTHWQEAKRPFFVGLAGAGMFFLGFISLMGAGDSNADNLSTSNAPSESQILPDRTPALNADAAPGQAADAAPNQAADAAPSQAAAQATDTAASPATAAPLPLPEAEKLDALKMGTADASLAEPTWHDPEPESYSANDPGGIPTKALTRFIGRNVVVLMKHGVPIRGKLVSAETESIRIERLLPSGSARYVLQRAELQEIRPVS